MKKLMIPKCDKCGSRIMMIETADGLPNGVGFELQDGSIITLCKSCIMDLGRARKSGKMEEWDKFLESAGK